MQNGIGNIAYRKFILTALKRGNRSDWIGEEKGFAGALFRWMLKHWLRKNQFAYDEIHFCSETESARDKVKICLQRKVDVLIDDKVENLLAVKDKIKIICYSAAWNEDYRELDGCRVRRMDEVRERVLGMGM